MTIPERQIEVTCEGPASIPCSIWSATDAPRGVVLIGHGLGVDRYHSTVRRPMEILALEHQAAVVVPEIPLHGVRAELPFDTPAIVDRWHQFWISGGIESIRGELQQVTKYCEGIFKALPVTYFGASLGTQYGIPFLAQTESIRSAVLGLFGSHPPPRTPVMNRFAPAVRCPVYFIQKLDDEIHSAESTTHLFSSLGAADKVLDSTHGGHSEVSIESVRRACAFLMSHAHLDQPASSESTPGAA